MLAYLPLGPAVIPSYPFLALIGLWAGMWLAAREAERLGIEGDHIYNLGLYSLLAGLIGGRASYVATHWDAYAGDLTQALALTANAIDIPYAILFALAVVVAYAARQRLSFPRLADAITPGAALALIIGGIGAFLGSQTLGTATSAPWGLPLYGQIRHPVHLYQALATLIILGIIWRARRNPRWPGFTFLLFAELYAGSRLLLDPFFDTTLRFDFGLRLVQVVALAVMVVILIAMMRIDLSLSTKTASANT